MTAQPALNEVRSWAEELDAVGGCLARRFARSEPRRRAVEYLRGLLSGVGRKNDWQLAEQSDDGPRGADLARTRLSPRLAV